MEPSAKNLLIREQRSQLPRKLKKTAANKTLKEGSKEAFCKTKKKTAAKKPAAKKADTN